MKRLPFALLVLGAVFTLGGCQSMHTAATKAVADLRPTQGHRTAGRVTFSQVGSKVEVHAVVTGLAPGQEHGFHVHEAGDCSSGDGMSTKGHFNPLGQPHGHHSTQQRHVGDMPNLKADANGRADARFTLDTMTVTEGSASVVGRGLIVHVQPDDYRSQPVGNAGARMACAVIRRA